MCVPDLCWSCLYNRCSGHKEDLVTASDSTDYIFHWHPQKICTFALVVRWLRNLITSAPYKTKNHSGKRWRRAEGGLGNNQPQWVTGRHSLTAMRNSLMITYKRTDDSTLRSRRGDKPGKCNKAITWWRKSSLPRVLFILICFAFHLFTGNIQSSPLRPVPQVV